MDDKYFYERESYSFLETLWEYHRNRGTPLPRFPVIGGKRIDLFKLYNAVTELGGWSRVNGGFGWEDLLSDFDIPRATGNGAQALKLIYARYLWPYEKHKRGEDLDDNFQEVDAYPSDRTGMRGGRPPKRPPASVNGVVALSYNHRQHELSDATRAQLGLAPSTPSGFRDILRSLSSSLPNEVDFTLNVCGVLSAEAQANPLSLTKAPSLLTLLLAQAGIYELSSSSSAPSSCHVDSLGDATLLVNSEEYNVKLRRNFWRFWLESTRDYPSMREFIFPLDDDDEARPSSSAESIGRRNDDNAVESMETDDVVEEEETSAASKGAEASALRCEMPGESQGSMASSSAVASSSANDDDDVESSAIRRRSKEDRNSESKNIWTKLESLIPTSVDSALGFGRKGGARDVEMARVVQVLVILRNLSFDEENKAAMTNDANCLRFLFLCIHSNHSNLMQMGLDTLANLASKFALDECGSKTTLLVFEMLHRLLHSEDRFQILRGLEILGSLATVESNEEILVNALGKEAFNRITELLTVTDLQILVGSLDCLYQITNASQLLCSLVMSATTRAMITQSVPANCPLGVRQLGTNKMIRLLVDFLTLEASSLGPAAVSSIRVVEIRPTTDNHSKQGLLPTPYQQTNYMYTANPGPAPPPPAPVNESVPAAAPVATPQQAQQHYVIQNSAQGRSSPVVIIPQQSGANYQICDNSDAQAVSGVVKQGPLQIVHGQPSAITVKGGRVIPVMIYQSKDYLSPSGNAKENAPPKTTSASRVEVNGEEFARNWLSCNYEAGSTNEHIARNSLYQAYMEVTKTYGLIKNEIVTSGAITKLVSIIFPSVIVRRIDDGSGQQLHHGGLRKKASPIPMPPLPPKHGPTTSVNASPSPSPASQVLTIATHISNATPNSMSAQSSPAMASPQTGPDACYPAQPQNETLSAKDQAAVHVDRPRDSNLVKSLLASKLTMKMEKSGLASPHSDIAVVATVLQQQQQQVPSDPMSVLNSPNSMKTYARTTTVTSESTNPSGHSSANNGLAKPRIPSSASSENVVDVQSDACSEDSRHSVSSLDSGKGSTTSVSPESHPHPPVASQANNGGGPSGVVKFESTLVKKMLAGVVADLNGEEDMAKDPKSTSALLPSVVNGGVVVADGVVVANGVVVVANGHPDRGEKKVPSGNEEGSLSLQHVAQTNGVRVNGILTANGKGVNASSQQQQQQQASYPESDPLKPGLKRTLESDDQANGAPDTKVVKREQNTEGIMICNAFVNGDIGQEAKMQLSSSVPAPRYHSIPVPSSTTPSGTVPFPPVITTSTIQQHPQHPITTEVSQQPNQHFQPQLKEQQQQPSMQQQQPSMQQQPFIQHRPRLQQHSPHPTKLPVEHTVKIIQPTTQSHHPVAPPGASIVIQTALHRPQPRQGTPPARERRQGTPPATGSPHPRVIIASGISSSPLPSPNSAMSRASASVPTNSTPMVAMTTPTTTLQSSLSATVLGGGEDYTCEWGPNCSRSFPSPKNLFHHVCTDHVNARFKEGNCLWGECDSMRRKRWSLVSHLQDRHCNEQALKLATIRRQHKLKFGTIPPNLLPPPAPQHPGYAPNAAMLAIKRHSHIPPVSEFINEQEGPVTRDIRLTSAIVLKNLARHSETAQRLILRHERLLSSVAFRCMEASNNVAQCLAYIPVWMRGSRKFSPDETLVEEDPQSLRLLEVEPRRKSASSGTGNVRNIVAGEIKIQEASEDDDSSQTIVITT